MQYGVLHLVPTLSLPVVSCMQPEAFGLGIDRPDVTLVVHMGLPDDVNEWWQMCGRAARGEGVRGLAVTFVHPRFLLDRLRVLRPQSEDDFSQVLELCRFLCSPGCGVR